MKDLQLREQSFKRRCYKGEEEAYFYEGDGLMYRCSGIWVIHLLKGRIILGDWFLG